MVKSTCRLLEPADIPRIRQLIEEKKQSLGVNFWLPEFSDPRTYRTFVFEIQGEIIGAIVFRTVWELILASDDPRSMAAGVEHNQKIREVLKRAGVDEVVAFVPDKLVTTQDAERCCGLSDCCLRKNQRKRGMEKLIERLGFRRIKNMTAFETGVR